jgi:site-specific DNA-cytosine methylase
MKYLSLFSGYGGFELGIQQAYELDDRHQETGSATCVGFSEVDKYAIQVYAKHFTYEECENCRLERNRQEDIRLSGGQETVNCSGTDLPQTKRPDGRIINSTRSQDCACKHKPYGDITKLDATTLPDFDLLCGGVPCQSWSIAGKRGGFEDERGNMWFQFSRILREKQPKYFLAENVKGLLSHDGGKSMERICEELCGCGYAIDFEVLNAKNFGVPQNRERVFIIGIRLDLLDECQIF